MNRYLHSCNNDSRKAMTLYRKNLKLSQELFTIISCFEVALRNAIDSHYLAIHGNNWLQNAALAGGFYDIRKCFLTKKTINETITKLGTSYTHSKLVAELGFGFWRYQFASHQFRVGGQTLLRILPNKPTSTPVMQYNANFMFNELKRINNIRNRIAHHDPICFRSGHSIIDTSYVNQHYQDILRFFSWMDINERDLLYGLDKVSNVIHDINNL